MSSSRISKAANAAVVNALTGGWPEQETSITGKVLGRVEQAVEGYSKNGIVWRAKTLTDHGPNTMEKEYGADFTGILDLEVPGYRVRKGFLAQSKLVKNGHIDSAEFERMVNQCRDMLNLSPTSFVFLYSRDGIRIVSAAASSSEFVGSSSSYTSPSPQPTSTNEPDGQVIADHILGDQPARRHTEDRLGFGPYVSAVAKFLTDSSTKIPLTLAIEGTWGMGKSSFMLLLQEELEQRGQSKIVQFNAWQYNPDEGLWAAFIHHFDDKLHERLSLKERVRARWMLFLLRARYQGWIETAMAVVTAGFWLLASGLAAFAVARFLLHGGISLFEKELASSGEEAKSFGKAIGVVGGIGGALASLLLFIHQAKDLFKSPASLTKTTSLFSKPNYDSRLPLIHQVARDFSSLVTAYAGQDSVYVFIDDLDRCEYSKAADLMQALLILLSSAPKVALIIGLDTEKVAAAMATKQEKLIPYLYRVQPADAYLRGIEYGLRFLEKFIQVSFVLPQPSPAGLKAMINPDVEPPAPSVPETQKSVEAINIVTGKDDSLTLNRMIDMADQVFDHNPRNVKQFVNIFRLHAFIANETGLFGSWRTNPKTGRPLTIPQLAKFVIVCLRWPRFIQDTLDNPWLIQSLEKPFRSGSASIPSTGPEGDSLVNYWNSQKGLVRLIGFGIETTEADSEDYFLSDVDFALLNEIAPARAQPTTSQSSSPHVPPNEAFYPPPSATPPQGGHDPRTFAS